MQKKDAFLEALLKEIELQKDYLTPSPSERVGVRSPSERAEVRSIYFGGGTPSLLSGDEIKKILEKISTVHPVSKDAEITLEANPDDLSAAKLKALKAAGINRLSIGIQSFSDTDLKFMNRVHNSEQALESVNMAKAEGFSNITADLIYGTPTLSNEQWIRNLQTVFSLNVPHLSCYSLTVEPKTTLAQLIKNGKVPPVDEIKSAEQFDLLMQLATGNGYEHYEISNFAKDNMYSQHNSNYWRNEKYLGIGPSAHSYNQVSRQWNIANNAMYIHSLEENKIPFEKEELTLTQRYNEYILTSLRTMWGCNTKMISREFDEKSVAHFNHSVVKFIDNGWIEKRDPVYVLSKEGKFFADKIASELFQ